ncbi:hypothetical protein EW026_g414 [Hermanssonia centrifuga]|uniref:Uncharacterized protein n=2 Tax=Hermanssonia centrifuga TaxID=98765 RepID=A0A4S4KUI5_9APHY|nr:hypothetical protein PHLCEN_2v840 [Hermanssonia centrifuga]THH02416.1 hypothetical protein EW026_g414 [Hermanssonia centrifuga]
MFISSESQPSTVSIRRATAEDSARLSYICLATADAGVSAESLHTAGELPGLMYAEPYVHVPEGFGFVLVDSSKPSEGHEDVVGYVLGTFDTRAFERSVKETWFPPYLEKYPLSALKSEPSENTPTHLRDLTPNDKHYIRTIHNPPSASCINVGFSPAHIHIDILPAYQRQGWGRRLIGEAVNYLRGERGLDKLWLGLDVRNANAKKFYQRLGLKEMANAPDGVMGLTFEDWKD